jgi:hypothetical protein
MEEEYIDIGSKIITIAIMLNGNIIKTNLEPAEQNIFDNTRLFKLANIVNEPGATFNEIQKNDIRISRIVTLNVAFQEDLPRSTYDMVKQIPISLSKRVNKDVNLYLPEKHTYNPFNITVDKEIGVDALPTDDNMVIGVYVVSVHEKTDENKFKIIYPSTEDERVRNLNLLKKTEFIEFANIFGKDGKTVLNTMFEKTSKWPDYDKKTDDETYKEELDKWNITFSPGGWFWNSYGDISHIRLSYLVDIIKEIAGRDKCKLNIFDYSPNALSPILSDDSTGTLYPYDIETGSRTTWGGRSMKRRIKRHRKRRNTRRNKDRRRVKK